MDQFVKIARYKEEVCIAKENVELIRQASDFVQGIVASERPVYGINTGFGKLANVAIKKAEVKKLQKNLLMSHACGVGDPFSTEVVRGMMLLRINALAKGYSGIRLGTLEKMVEFLNKDFTPIVYSQGSLGGSGDLAPIAHMSIPLIGVGEVEYLGKRLPAIEGLRQAGIAPLPDLEAKEGLSLINGTQAMTAVGAFVIYDALNLEKTATLALALTMEALEGIIDAFDPKIMP